MSRQHPLAAELVEVAREFDRRGLMPNKSGNLSCRTGRGLLITPAGLPYAELDPAQLVELRLDGSGASNVEGLRPSSEWRMHAAVYAARGEVAAIVHTHSPRATALACARRGIPAFHYMIALAGGDIRCAPYATFGSSELARNALEGLRDRRATLLANHGVLAAGATLSEARSIALEVENLAGEYLALLAAGLEPVLLDAAELGRVLERFADYGRVSKR